MSSLRWLKGLSVRHLRHFLVVLLLVSMLAQMLTVAPSSQAQVLSNDELRALSVAEIVNALEAYADNAGSYQIPNAGFEGTGQGAFSAGGTDSYPFAISQALVDAGFLDARFMPSEPTGGLDLMVYWCVDRVAVFAISDEALPSQQDSIWWSSNGCTGKPFALGREYFKLSEPLDVAPSGASPVYAVARAIEAYGRDNGSYIIEGAGAISDGTPTGHGWVALRNSTSYRRTLRDALITGGYLNVADTEAVPPNWRTGLYVRRCRDRFAVFAHSEQTTSVDDALWWDSNGCSTWITDNYDHNFMVLGAPLSRDDIRRADAAQIVGALETLGQDTDSYRLAGAGWSDKGSGWWSFENRYHDEALGESLARAGYLNPFDLPRDPEAALGYEHDYYVQNCGERVAVFTLSNEIEPDPADAAWWSANDCSTWVSDQYGHSYFDLSASLDADGVRQSHAAQILAAYQAYGQQNFTYKLNAGFYNRGYGDFNLAGKSGYSTSLASVLVEQGLLSREFAESFGAASYLVYRCGNRVAVFTARESIGPDPVDAAWWADNDCYTWPISNGREYFTLSDPLPLDPERVQVVANAVAAFEAYAAVNGTYLVAGAGHEGNGDGWFSTGTTNYQTNLAERLLELGHLAPSERIDDPWAQTDSSYGLRVELCKDRLAVFSRSDVIEPEPADAVWWADNECSTYPTTHHDQTYFVLTRALDDNVVDAARQQAAAAVVVALERYAEDNATYRIEGAGQQATGNGWFSDPTGSYSQNAAQALANGGYFAAGQVPEDPRLAEDPAFDFWIQVCGARAAVFTASNGITANEADQAWWDLNRCGTPPGSHSNFVLTAPLAGAITPNVPYLELLPQVEDDRTAVVLHPNGAIVRAAQLAVYANPTNPIIDCSGTFCALDSDNAGMVAVAIEQPQWTAPTTLGYVRFANPTTTSEATTVLLQAITGDGESLVETDSAASPVDYRLGSSKDDRPGSGAGSTKTTKQPAASASLFQSVQLAKPDVGFMGSVVPGGSVAFFWGTENAKAGYNVFVADRGQQGYPIQVYADWWATPRTSVSGGPVSDHAARTCIAVSAKNYVENNVLHYQSGSTRECVEVGDCDIFNLTGNIIDDGLNLARQTVTDAVLFVNRVTRCIQGLTLEDLVALFNRFTEFFADAVLGCLNAGVEAIHSGIYVANPDNWDEIYGEFRGLANEVGQSFNDGTQLQLAQELGNAGLDEFSRVDTYQNKGIGSWVGDFGCNAAFMVAGGAVTSRLSRARTLTRAHNRSDTTINPDGTTTRTNPDGSTTTNFPDDTSVTDFPDGTRVTAYPDGTRVTRQTNGITITQNPDGSLKVVRDGSRDFEIPPDRFNLGCSVTNSFPAGTLVRLDSGNHKPIEAIEPGDVVTSYDVDTSSWVAATVTAQWSAIDDGVIGTIELDDGSNVSATDHHRFWVESSQAWTELDLLNPGDVLLSPQGEQTVASISLSTPATTRVWELTVADTHNFTVQAGTSDLLVHNEDGCFTVELDADGEIVAVTSGDPAVGPFERIDSDLTLTTTDFDAVGRRRVVTDFDGKGTLTRDYAGAYSYVNDAGVNVDFDIAVAPIFERLAQGGSHRLTTSKAFADWAAPTGTVRPDLANLTDANWVDGPDWIAGAADGLPDLTRFGDVLDVAIQTTSFRRITPNQVRTFTFRSNAEFDDILPLVNRLDEFRAIRELAGGDHIAWNILGQGLQANPIPGYGPLQALRRLEVNAPPLAYIDADGKVWLVGIRGNTYKLQKSADFVPQDLDPYASEPVAGTGAIEAFVDGDTVSLTVVYRPIAGVDANGTQISVPRDIDFDTLTVNGVKDSRTVIFDTQSQSSAVSPDSYFTSSPGDFTETNRSFRAFLSTPEGQSHLAGLPTEVQSMLNDWRTLTDNRVRPPGYIWHHTPSTGRYQLVYEPYHDALKHGGGSPSYGNASKFPDGTTKEPGFLITMGELHGPN